MSAFNPYLLMLGIGSAASGITGLSNNPAQEAMAYSEKLPETVTPYYQPYIDTGLQSMDTLATQLNKLATDPAAVMAMLGATFQQSPGYQWQYDQAMQGATNAAAAGGMAGGSAHQQQSASMAQNLAAQDYWNYMDYLFNLGKGGLSGLGGLTQLGYGASDALASLLAQNLMNQAALAAQSAQQENSALGSLVGGVTGAVSSIF